MINQTPLNAAATNEKVYRFSKGLRLIIYCLVPLVIAFLILLLLAPLTEFPAGFPAKSYGILAPFFVFMIGLMGLGILDAYKARFIIGPDRIVSINAFTTRELLFNEIKGYRLSDKFTFIESNIEGKKKIKVSKNFGNVKEVESWLEDHYPDLDLQNEAEEREAILNNEEFGFTPEERTARLKTARFAARMLNGLAIISVILFIFFSNRPSFIAVSALPLVAIAALKYFKGLIRINIKKGTAYPSVFWVFFCCCLALGVKALASYHILHFANAWKPVLLVTIVFTALLFINNRQLKKPEDYFGFLGLLVFAFCYAFGIVINTNCLFDDSTPASFEATILEKRVTRGKSTSYHIELSAWGPQKETDDIVVSKRLYDAVYINGTAHVYLKKGRLDIPWFIITE